MTSIDPVDLYLDLVKKSVTRALQEDGDEVVGFNPWGRSPWKRIAATAISRVLGRLQLELVRKRPYNAHLRQNGLDWPSRAESMAGIARMDNVIECIRSVAREGVPGDVIETGVWRGGTIIMMAAVLVALGDEERKIWAADSFEGLPRPDSTTYPADEGDSHFRLPELAVGVDQVRQNLRRYGLLNDRIEFLVGFFQDTLPTAPIGALAVLRLDGDMYASTMQALDPLYPKLSSGGFCIIDDYHQVPACKSAVDDYRQSHLITDELIEIDGSAVFWKKS